MKLPFLALLLLVSCAHSALPNRGIASEPQSLPRGGIRLQEDGDSRCPDKIELRQSKHFISLLLDNQEICTLEEENGFLVGEITISSQKDPGDYQESSYKLKVDASNNIAAEISKVQFVDGNKTSESHLNCYYSR